MSAEAARHYVGITEHVQQSLGYLLYTGLVPVYDRVTGAISTNTIPGIVPGILIRPTKTLLNDLPVIDLRDDESKNPYLTWFQQNSFPVDRAGFGGRAREVSYWEIDVKLGSETLPQYGRIQDAVTSLLARNPTLDIYFWHVGVSGGAPSQGDIIAQGIISDISVVPRVDISTARGEDGYIVVNFSLAVWKEEA